jgi:putative colanic acid biosynthesis glycosyltransferase
VSPVLTIITVCRNARADLRQTAASVHHNKPDWVEYIVVDGASNDGTLDDLRAGVPGLDRYVSEPDSGLYDAMNKGAKLAAGSYVMFLNAGDLLLETYSDPVHRTLVDGRFDLVFGQTLFAKPGVADRVQRPEPGRLEEGMFVNHQSTLCRTAHFLASDGFDTSYSLAADYDLMLRSVKRAAKSSVVDVRLVSFAAGGLSTQMLVKYRRQVIASQFRNRSSKRYSALVTYHLRGVVYYWAVKYLRLKR